VDFILSCGVRQVIVGMIDPNPLNNGRGIKILRQHGMKVEVGFLEDELKRLNESFIKYTTQRMPFVTVKVGQSLDGKIASRTGDSKWITSDASRNYARRLRGYFDAIMAGVNTVRKDNPRLDAYSSERQPLKIIVDSQLSTPQNAQIFSQDSKVILVSLPSNPGQETENRKILSQKARILDVREKSGQVNLKDMLKRLSRLGVTNIMVEGGGSLIGSLFDEGLVDKVIFFIAPKIIGGKGATSSVMGSGVSRIEKAYKLKEMSLQRIGEDILVEGYIK
jgi:diaminohydroxyphosphoribosylaminopyrimidine deaminase/5-amino-6-(5-phosphoribosylamino)uracil reductase